jgi:general stress protein YciG
MTSNSQGNKGSNQAGDAGNRGFASMDPKKQREIASEGGRAAHASGNAHEFNSEEAQANSQSAGNNSGSGSTRGGSSEQHAKAGSQSHKNDKR